MTLLVQILMVVLAVAGTALVLLGAVGILVLTDVYTRMQAASKAGSLGAACILLSAAVYFSELELVVRALTALVFLMLTIPVAAHVLGRAAYLAGVPLAKESVMDELHGRVDGRADSPGGQDEPRPPDPAPE